MTAAALNRTHERKANTNNGGLMLLLNFAVLGAAIWALTQTIAHDDGSYALLMAFLVVLFVVGPLIAAGRRSSASSRPRGWIAWLAFFGALGAGGHAGHARAAGRQTQGHGPPDAPRSSRHQGDLAFQVAGLLLQGGHASGLVNPGIRAWLSTNCKPARAA